MQPVRRGEAHVEIPLAALLRLQYAPRRSGVQVAAPVVVVGEHQLVQADKRLVPFLSAPEEYVPVPVAVKPAVVRRGKVFADVLRVVGLETVGHAVKTQLPPFHVHRAHWFRLGQLYLRGAPGPVHAERVCAGRGVVFERIHDVIRYAAHVAAHAHRVQVRHLRRVKFPRHQVEVVGGLVPVAAKFGVVVRVAAVHARGKFAVVEQQIELGKAAHGVALACVRAGVGLHVRVVQRQRWRKSVEHKAVYAPGVQHGAAAPVPAGDAPALTLAALAPVAR